MSELNLVCFRLKTGETCFGELTNYDSSKIEVNNILEVDFDGFRATAVPFSPFIQTTELNLKKSDLLFCEPLGEEYYRFYCNVVIAARSVIFDIQANMNDNKHEIEFKRDAELAYLKLKFNKWIATSKYNAEVTSNGKVVLH